MYIIYDLECNCWLPRGTPQEIIQIAAVKLTEHLEHVDTFMAYVKPTLVPELTPQAVELTGITQDLVDGAESFNEVLTKFVEWVGEDYYLVSWGFDDLLTFKKNCELNGINKEQRGFLNNHNNIQKQFSVHLGLPKGRTMSLKNAVETLGIEFKGEAHDALVDALNTAQVFIRLVMFKKIMLFRNPAS